MGGDKVSQQDLIAGRALKSAAVELEREVQARVHDRQGGVPTYFDNFLLRTIAALRRLDMSRRWEDSLAGPTGGEAARLGQQLLRLRRFLTRRAGGRLVEYDDRLAAASRDLPRSEVDGATFAMSQGTDGPLQWRGLPLFKSVFDLSLYAQLLWDLKPRSVLELGSGSGASALWLADHLRLFETGGRVLSLDLKAPAVRDERVSFLEGDCRRIGEALSPALLGGLEHPLLVIEDAHVNVEEVLAHLHQVLDPGDYLAVEDSTIKTEALSRFLARHPGAYRVDTRYTDFFGRNATSCFDSILVRSADGAR